jgi:hypothetical protein
VPYPQLGGTGGAHPRRRRRHRAEPASRDRPGARTRNGLAWPGASRGPGRPFDGTSAGSFRLPTAEAAEEVLPVVVGSANGRRWLPFAPPDALGGLKTIRGIADRDQDGPMVVPDLVAVLFPAAWSGGA